MTYIQIVDKVENSIKKHKQLGLNNLDFGSPMNNVGLDCVYPHVFIEPIPINTTEQTNIFKFRIHLMDIVDEDLSNYEDVLNDTSLILNDLINYLKYTNTDYFFIINNTITPFNEKFDDFCAGYYTDFEIQTNRIDGIDDIINIIVIPLYGWIKDCTQPQNYLTGLTSLYQFNGNANDSKGTNSGTTNGHYTEGFFSSGLTLSGNSSDLYFDFEDNINDIRGKYTTSWFDSGVPTTPTYLTGKVGKAIHFDETIGNCLEIESGTTNLGETLRGDFTINFWAKEYSTSNSVMLGTQLADGDRFLYRNVNGIPQFRAVLNGIDTDYRGQIIINNDTWNFFTIKSNDLRNDVYVNGEVLDTAVIYRGSNFNIDKDYFTNEIGNTFIGAMNNEGGIYLPWTGDLDEFNIYNQDLPLIECRKIYNNGTGTTYSGNIINPIKVNSDIDFIDERIKNFKFFLRNTYYSVDDYYLNEWKNNYETEIQIYTSNVESLKPIISGDTLSFDTDRKLYLYTGYSPAYERDQMLYERDWTMMFNIKYDALSARQTIYYYGAGSSTQNGIWINNRINYYQVLVSDGISRSVYRLYLTNDTVVDQWYNVIITYTASEKKMRIYLDGVLDAETDVSGVDFSDQYNDGVGYIGDITAYPLNGKLENFMIANNYLATSGDCAYFNNALKYENKTETIDEPLSIGAWIKVEEDDDNYIIHQRDETTQGSYNNFEFKINKDKKLQFTHFGDNENIRMFISGTTELELNEWYYVLYTYDGSQSLDGMKLYLNGEEEEILDSNKDPYYKGMTYFNRFWIGSFKGVIDDLGIWGRVLTSTESTLLYNDGVGIEYIYYECKWTYGQTN